MKKKFLAMAIIATMVFSFTSCSSKKEETKTPKVTTEKKQDSKTEEKRQEETKPEVTPEPAVEPKTEPIPTPVEPQMLDDATKATLKQFVEPCIYDVYKTTFYTCDILTPSEGSGGIVSVQIESPSFTDSATCNSTIKDIIGKMLGDEKYSGINSFDFTMLADGQMKFLIRVNDAQSITTIDDIDSHLDSTAF